MPLKRRTLQREHFRVVHPLYGIPESRLHWYILHLEHHEETLGMKRLTTDPCELLKQKDEKLEGMVTSQVDVSLVLGTEVFLGEEELASKRFRKKPRIGLKNTPIHFNGTEIPREGDSIKMHQAEKTAKLKPLITQNDFASARTMAQHIGVETRPDVIASVQKLGPGESKTTENEFILSRKVIKRLQSDPRFGLTFESIDLGSTKLIRHSYSSSWNVLNLRNQLGSVILLTDNDGRRISFTLRRAAANVSHDL